VPLDFAQRLYFWVRHGFPELGDYSGMGCGGVVGRSVFSQSFLTDPHAAAQHVYDTSKGWAAANGAVMRTSILGIPCFHQMDTVLANTDLICRTTHADPRCIASCFAATAIIATLLKGDVYDAKQPSSINGVIDLAMQHATKCLGRAQDRDHLKEFIEHMNAKSIDDLQLDEGSRIGYTFKCIGSGVYYLRHSNNFFEAMNQLALEGGDADTNCAVAGALLGCKLGFSALPKVWLDKLKERVWLEAKVQKFLNLLGLK